MAWLPTSKVSSIAEKAARTGGGQRGAQSRRCGRLPSRGPHKEKGGPMRRGPFRCQHPPRRARGPPLAGGGGGGGGEGGVLLTRYPLNSCFVVSTPTPANKGNLLLYFQQDMT